MKTNRLKGRSEQVFDWTMAGVPTVAFVVLYLLPCIAGFYFCFTDFGGYSLDFKMVGLHNFEKMFQDPIFYKSIWNYIILYIGTVVLCFPVAMGAAIVLTRNRAIKEKNFYRVLFFFPSTVPTMIIALMWMVMYNPTFGVLNQFLGLFGVEPIQWLGSSKVVMISVIVMVVWRQFGFYLVYFMAGVSNIDQGIYESAKIDGASEWKQVFTITIPLCWEVVRTSLLFYIQSAASIGFGIIYIATRGGPDNASQTLASYMYYQITENLDYGYGSVLGIALLIVTLLLAAFILAVTKRESYEM